VNIISELFVENVNATDIDVSPGFNEWTISGLTKEKKNVCVHIFDAIYALTTMYSSVNKSLLRQGERF
jgi:hypothetical protein